MTVAISTSLMMTVERALRIFSSWRCSAKRAVFESLKVVPSWMRASIVVMVRNARMPSGMVSGEDMPFFEEKMPFFSKGWLPERRFPKEG